MTVLTLERPLARGAFECTCCNLPIVDDKSPGMGYWCPTCLSHDTDLQNPWGPPPEDGTWDGLQARIEAEHAELKRLFALLPEPEPIAPKPLVGTVNCMTDDPVWNVAHLVVANLSPTEGLTICGVVLNAGDQPKFHEDRSGQPCGCAPGEQWPRCNDCQKAKINANLRTQGR